MEEKEAWHTYCYLLSDRYYIGYTSSKQKGRRSSHINQSEKLKDPFHAALKGKQSELQLLWVHYHDTESEAMTEEGQVIDEHKAIGDCWNVKRSTQQYCRDHSMQPRNHRCSVCDYAGYQSSMFTQHFNTLKHGRNWIREWGPLVYIGLYYPFDTADNG